MREFKFGKYIEKQINDYKWEVIISLIVSYIVSIILFINGEKIEISFPNFPFIRIILSFLTFGTIGAILYKLLFYKIMYKIIIFFGNYRDFKNFKKWFWFILIVFTYYILNFLIKLAEMLLNFLLNLIKFEMFLILFTTFLSIILIFITKKVLEKEAK